MSIRLAESISLPVRGDGSSTVLVVDLASPPLRLKFENGMPSGVTVSANPSATATIAGTIVTVTFSSAPAVDGGSATLTLLYG